MAALRSAAAGLKLQLGPEAWHNFKYDALASVLFSLFNVVFNQFYIPMAIRQGATNLEVGLLSAAPAIGLLFSPLWAAWIERTSPRRFVLYPNLAARFLLLLPAFFGAPVVYVAVALVFHMLMGIQAPAYAAFVTRIYPPQHRGKLMGNVRVAMGFLMIPLAFTVGAWTDAAGPSQALIWASLTGVISILVFGRIREIGTAPATPAAVRRSSLREQFRLVRRNRELAVFFVASTFTGFGNILAGPLYQIIQVDKLELSNTQIGLARVVYFLCLLGAYFIVGWVIDRFSAKATIVYGLGAFAAVPLLYGLFGNYASVLVGSGIQGAGDAIWDIGIMAYLFRLAPGREAVVFGLHLLLFGIRGSVGPLLSTWLAGSMELSYLLYGAALCGAAGTLVFVMLAGKRLKPQTLE